jgi:ABC-type transport system involved in multi-copper enzyme maturation permease subunit
LTDKELSLLDQGESLFILSEVVLSVGIIVSAANAASSISGEIESGTLENLLLTPISHRQLAAEKLLSVFALWAMLYVVSIPYLIVVASGTNLGFSAVLYVGLYGSLLVFAISSLSIAISARLDSSKSSLMVVLMIVLMLLAPSIFFSTSLKKTNFGLILENLNPVSHAINSLDSVLVDNEQALAQQIVHIMPIIAFLALCTILFVRFSRRFEIRGSQ